MAGIRKLIAAAKRAGQASPPIAAALPFSHHPKGAKEAVLLLHGYTGYPDELAIIGRYLDEAGIACAAPRLSGHGSSRADMLSATARDWIRQSFDAYLNLRSEYALVHVLGHSMGALLALLTAAAFDAPKAALLAPALMTNRSLLPLTPIVSLLFPVLRQNRPIKADASPDRRVLHDAYWADELISAAAQLYKVQKAARRCLPRTRSHLFVVLGEQDQTIPLSAASYLRRKAVNAASLEEHIIPGANHRFPFETGAEQAARLTTDWLKR